MADDRAVAHNRESTLRARVAENLYAVIDPLIAKRCFQCGFPLATNGMFCTDACAIRWAKDRASDA